MIDAILVFRQQLKQITLWRQHNTNTKPVALLLCTLNYVLEIKKVLFSVSFAIGYSPNEHLIIIHVFCIGLIHLPGNIGYIGNTKEENHITWINITDKILSGKVLSQARYQDLSLGEIAGFAAHSLSIKTDEMRLKYVWAESFQLVVFFALDAWQTSVLKVSKPTGKRYCNFWYHRRTFNRHFLMSEQYHVKSRSSFHKQI